MHSHSLPQWKEYKPFLIYDLRRLLERLLEQTQILCLNGRLHKPFLT
jgi:hypothetical protein